MTEQIEQNPNDVDEHIEAFAQIAPDLAEAQDSKQ